MKTCSILIALALLGSSSAYAFDKLAKEQSAKEEGTVQKTVEKSTNIPKPASNYPKITFKGHIDTGFFRDNSEDAQATLGDSRIVVKAKLADRLKATVRAKIARLDFYDEHGGRKGIEEIIDIATLEINVHPSGVALVIGKLSVLGTVNKDAGLFYHKNKIRSHTSRKGYMGVMLKLEGEGLSVLQSLVDEFEVSVFETKKNDFKFEDKVGGSIRITRNLTDSTKLKISQLILSSDFKRQTCSQDDSNSVNTSNIANCLVSIFDTLDSSQVDASNKLTTSIFNLHETGQLDDYASSLTTTNGYREYVTSLGISNASNILGKKTFSWVEGISVRNYLSKSGKVRNTIGATAGADVNVYHNIYTTLEGTHLDDRISEGVASVRYEFDSGIVVGTEARLRNDHEADQKDVFVGGMVRYDFRK